MKPIEYYKWETKKVSIVWHGITQPLGRFFTAIDAIKEVKRISEWDNSAKDYQLNCDGEILNVSDYINQV